MHLRWIALYRPGNDFEILFIVHYGSQTALLGFKFGTLIHLLCPKRNEVSIAMYIQSFALYNLMDTLGSLHRVANTTVTRFEVSQYLLCCYYFIPQHGMVDVMKT